MSANETPSSAPPSTQGAPGEWLKEHPADAFARWFPEMEASLAATIDLVVAAAGIGPGMTVLDVGCGAGIPALRLAEIVGADGRVVAADPSAVLITAVTKNAAERGLTNVEPVQASAAGLPFSPESFDAVTCTFGVMFFTDLKAGLVRIRELLRPGARAVFTAWGSPAENMLMGLFRGVIAPYLPEPLEPSPPPDPSAPSPMRFAEPGSLSAALMAAGYGDVREETPLVQMPWPGPPGRLLDSLLDISNIEQDVPADQHEAMRADLLRAYEQFHDGDVTRLPARIVIASGSRKS